MPRRFSFQSVCLQVCLVTILSLTACRKSRAPNSEVVPTAVVPVAAPAPSQAPPPQGGAPAPSAGTGQDVVASFLNSSEFADLSKAYQVFYYQKKRHTADLQELVRERYIRAIPPPPPGKSYAVDQKQLKIILVP